MGKAWFEYKGVNSLDMYLRIENDISFPSPEADVEFVSVLGKDGELVINNNRLKNVDFSLPVQLRLPSHVTVNEQATKINEWLKSEIGWFELRFSGQPEYVYTAICYQRFDIAETLKQYGRTVIPFQLKPVKKDIRNKLETLTNGQTLVNIHEKASKPYIKVTGSGDITLQNNGVDWLVLTGVESFIEIDSEVMSAYKQERLQNEKMNANLRPLFPLLTKGENTITWTGAVEKIELNPRAVVVT